MKTPSGADSFIIVKLIFSLVQCAPMDGLQKWNGTKCYAFAAEWSSVNQFWTVLLILKSSLCAANGSPKIPSKGLQAGVIEAGFSVYNAAFFPGAKKKKKWLCLIDI